MRKRRIAADEAHAWARNLRLANHHAKSVLCALSLYIDGEGACFVGIDQLAADTELSPATIRRRLAWLERIGAIERRPQWIDADGHRGGKAGKRTTDLIRLMTDTEPGEIEAKAAGFSPSSQQGLNPVSPYVSPPAALTLALPQPYHCCKGLISEPEPEPEPELSGVDNFGGKAEQPSRDCRTKPVHGAKGRGMVWLDHGTAEWQSYADDYFEKRGVKKKPERRVGGHGNWFVLMGEPESRRSG